MSLVLEKAAELAAALENCEELKDIKVKQEALRADAEAEEMLSVFFQMQQQLYSLQEQGKEPDPELTAQFNEIQDKMEKNPRRYGILCKPGGFGANPAADQQDHHPSHHRGRRILLPESVRLLLRLLKS